MRTKVFAAYLPQYHETEDNNLFWGKGFTDWVGVKKATPQFKDHYQPRIPLGKNYYNLLDVETIRQQAELANNYGIDGFNIYHYWFKDGKQELEKPAEILLKQKDIQILFFFTWDNSAWRRTWGNVRGNDWAPAFDQKVDAKNECATLVPFEYGDERQWEKHFEYLLPFFRDERYYRIDNKPVFMLINSNSEVETLQKMGLHWDKLAKKYGFNGIYLATKKKNFFSTKLFDDEFYYEPETSAWGKRRAIEKRIQKKFGITPKRDGAVKYLYSYDKVWKRILKKSHRTLKKNIIGSFVRYDDTPRRGKDAMVIVDETPEKFEFYFSKLYKLCCKNNKPILLLTAWNEWGEGAYIEPDEKDEFAYLEALKKAVSKND
ncbi:MAG: glycoside hydrolase family 99-like domain-containing protein [Lachnospiraceae bacterium]|nr:glycoside hydrolase family 99-like domain-containing protein [Lachnospiraceae bacterium]